MSAENREQMERLQEAAENDVIAKIDTMETDDISVCREKGSKHLESLRDQILEADARVSEATTARDTVMAGVKQTHAAVFKEYEAASQALKDLEEKTRETILSYYRSLGKEVLPDGFGIRVYTIWEYDEAELFRWALKHAPIMLRIDNAEVQRLLKAGRFNAYLPVPAHQVEKPTATISTKLKKK
jgi:hypothetical protein